MSNLPTSSLVALLSSPDPHERDEIAYTELARRIEGGDEDHALARIGDLMATRFSDSEIQVRTFAALMLAEVVDRDRITGLASQSSVTRWRDAFAAWYRSEEDLRGWDDRLGWLHAVAHGADALGAFGRSPRLDPDDLTGLLALGRDRLLTGTEVVFANQEDDRLAYAIALVLTRQELEGHQITGWLEGIRVRFAARGGLPPEKEGQSRRGRPTRCAPCACSISWLTGASVCRALRPADRSSPSATTSTCVPLWLKCSA